MSSIPFDSSTVGAKADARATTDAPALTGPLARAALIYGLAIGVGADACIRDGPVGLGFLVWIALCGLAMVGILARAGHVVRRETLAWLGSAVLFAALATWRNDEGLRAFNVLSALVSLGIAATVAAGRPFGSIFAARVRDFIEAALRTVADAVIGVLILVTRDRALASGDHGTRRVYTVIRSLALTLPVLIVFLLLLRSADPVFASMVALPEWEFDVIMSHILITGFFGWASAGWMRRAVAASNAAVRRADPAEGGADQAPIAGIGLTEITVLLASLGVLFVLFVAVQVGWLFGGETMIRERTNLTVAQYARRGFFELVWVTLLIIPVLLATRTLLPAKPAERRRHSQLALPLVGLVGLIMVSAFYRMQMYVSYFGLTTDRLFATVFMLWLGAVLAWLAWTVLRERGTPFLGGAVVAGLFGLAVLNVIDPNAIVARTNLSREPIAVSTPVPVEGQTGTDTVRYRGVDLAYLSRLTDGAVPLVIAAVERAPAMAGDTSRLESRCAAARQIAFPQRHVTADQLTREAHWRTWNVGGSRERRLKVEHRKAMLDIVHACPSARPRPVSVPG
jgi:hypothetical protein